MVLVQTGFRFPDIFFCTLGVNVTTAAVFLLKICVVIDLVLLRRILKMNIWG